ncbi:MAG: hypothetical protein ACREAR_07195 [Nitrosotalea sp.]
MKIQNSKTKTITTIMGALAIGMILLSPTMMFPDISATTSQPMPAEVTTWLNSHPNYFGCVHTNLKTHVSKEVSCAHPELKPHEQMKNGTKIQPTGDFTYTVSNLDCSSSCWVGGEFNDDGPYNEITATTTIPSAPTNSPNDFSYWASLDQCSPSSCPSPGLLVQSGWLYESSQGTTPQMFTEIVGSFTLSGQTQNCSQIFCGTIDSESANDQIYTANYASTGNSEWVAYAQDNTVSPSFSDYFMVPFSTAGVSNSLPYAFLSTEAVQTPDTTYWPPSSISFTSVTLYSPGHGQVNTNTNNMAQWDTPTCGTCTLSETFTATGSTTATITNSW